MGQRTSRWDAPRRRPPSDALPAPATPNNLTSSALALPPEWVAFVVGVAIHDLDEDGLAWGALVLPVP